MSIDINRAASVVEELCAEGTRLNTEFAAKMNQIILTIAMQRGYAMACADLGLPVPHMENPAAYFEMGF